MPVLATQPRVYLGFAALCFVPMVLRIALVGDVYSLQLAGILLLLFSLTTLLARNYRQALQRAIDLQMNQRKTCVIEIMCTRELGDPFRRDALAKPVRFLDKYKDYV